MNSSVSLMTCIHLCTFYIFSGVSSVSIGFHYLQSYYKSGPLIITTPCTPTENSTTFTKYRNRTTEIYTRVYTFLGDSTCKFYIHEIHSIWSFI